MFTRLLLHGYYRLRGGVCRWCGPGGIAGHFKRAELSGAAWVRFLAISYCAAAEGYYLQNGGMEFGRNFYADAAWE